jgi:hypothetical protein
MWLWSYGFLFVNRVRCCAWWLWKLGSSIKAACGASASGPNKMHTAHIHCHHDNKSQAKMRAHVCPLYDVFVDFTFTEGSSKTVLDEGKPAAVKAYDV